MTQILFGQSYYLRFDPKLWDAMMPYPPLGTLYAASYIRSRGYDVALFDAMLAESEEEGPSHWMNTSRNMRSFLKITSIIFPRCACCGCVKRRSR
ncbi:hypothetical protein [Candidatus Villigracilis affinis]|uniref:hypothetical protein n=1 Tax=Candidatus Villigracilis affinis TaxID=3140682 RepID=UPI0031E66768